MWFQAGCFYFGGKVWEDTSSNNRVYYNSGVHGPGMGCARVQKWVMGLTLLCVLSLLEAAAARPGHWLCSIAQQLQALKHLSI